MHRDAIRGWRVHPVRPDLRQVLERGAAAPLSGTRANRPASRLLSGSVAKAELSFRTPRRFATGEPASAVAKLLLRGVLAHWPRPLIPKPETILAWVPSAHPPAGLLAGFGKGLDAA
jgi:hypothetical protein